jgi:ribosomal protein L11 methylase PrmA
LAVWVARRTVTTAEPRPEPLLFAGPIAAVADRLFDIVVCNMIASHFEPILADIRRVLVPGGKAVFSGILGEDSDAVRFSIESSGFDVTNEHGLGEWLCIWAVRGED